MPSNKKPRKKYRPRAVDPRASLERLANESREYLGEQVATELLDAAEASREAIERGKGREEDLVSLAVASNVAMLLAEQGFAKNMLADIQAAQDELTALNDRFYAGKGLVLTGPGILAVRLMLDIHKAQVEHPDCSVGRVRTALIECHRRMMAGEVLNAQAVGA